MKTALITGGLGYLGLRLSSALLEAGWRLRIVDRGFFGVDAARSLLDDDRVEWRKEDIRWIGDDAYEGVDAAFDLAGLSNDPSCDLDPRLTEDINLKGGLHAANAAKRLGVRRYVYSSSCSVYGTGASHFLDESSPVNPVSAYAKSKVEAEKGILGLAGDGFEPVVLRNATVYGLSPRMRFDLVINLMTLFAFREGKVFIMGGGRQWRPLVHIEDACRAFLLAADAPWEKVSGKTFNVGSNEQNYQVIQLAHMVKGVMPEIELIVAPDDADRRTYHVNFGRIASELGFKPLKTPIDAIREILQALRDGKVQDELATRTVDYYRYLIDAKKTLDEIVIDGRLF